MCHGQVRSEPQGQHQQQAQQEEQAFSRGVPSACLPAGGGPKQRCIAARTVAHDVICTHQGAAALRGVQDSDARGQSASGTG